MLQSADSVRGSVSTVGLAATEEQAGEDGGETCPLGRDACLSAGPDAESAVDMAA